MEKDLKRLHQMKGSKFQYRDKKITLTDFIERGAITVLIFDDNGAELRMDKSTDKLGAFLDCLKPVIIESPKSEISSAALESSLPAQMIWEPPILRENKKMLIKLRDALLEDMDMVRKDKTYIPQAKQACNTANSIINLAKVEIMMLRSE